MGSRGLEGTLVIGGPVNLEPITGTLDMWESGIRQGMLANLQQEHGALFTADGEPVIGYGGDEHTIHLDDRVLNLEGGTFTHYHPDPNFGGTLSMADLGVLAQSKLGELRAVSSTGQLYSVKAGQNADREGLARWIKMNRKLAQRNFEKSYDAALKAATTPLKSGPHKGQVKLVNRQTGKVIYRNPMTPQQAATYARQFSTGMFDRMYQKALTNFGFTYTATKAGKNAVKW